MKDNPSNRIFALNPPELDCFCFAFNITYKKQGKSNIPNLSLALQKSLDLMLISMHIINYHY